MGSSVSFSNSSDSGDWINAFGDSYNAFISQGEFASVSAADLDLMCAEGWNDRAACGTPATPTPEPATLALLGTSLLGFAALRAAGRDRSFPLGPARWAGHGMRGAG